MCYPEMHDLPYCKCGTPIVMCPCDKGQGATPQPTEKTPSPQPEERNMSNPGDKDYEC